MREFGAALLPKAIGFAQDLLLIGTTCFVVAVFFQRWFKRRSESALLEAQDLAKKWWYVRKVWVYKKEVVLLLHSQSISPYTTPRERCKVWFPSTHSNYTDIMRLNGDLELISFRFSQTPHNGLYGVSECAYLTLEKSDGGG